MRRTMRKDLFRAITKSLGRFLSIFLIVALGCGFFAGIKASGPDMKEAADGYYDETSLMDLQLISELGFSQENVQAISETQGVSAVMPSWQTTLVTINQGENLKIRVQSISADEGWDELNNVTVIDGRLPEKSSECLIDDVAVKSGDYTIGQTLSFEDIDENADDSMLSGYSFTIAGTVDSPLYISFSGGSSKLGSDEPDYNIFVAAEAFSSDIYTNIYVTADNASSVNSYSDEYTDRVDTVLSDVKETGVKESDLRRADVIEQQLADLVIPDGASEEQIAGAKAAAAESLDTLTNTWYYLDRTAIAGFSSFKDDTERIDAIAAIFPVFFFGVAALVSLTTMTRMVDEERMQIGSLKAFGYSRRSIAMKYVYYASLASALGGLCGLLTGFQLFPRVIYNAYLIMYRLPPIQPPFRVDLAWLTLAIAVGSTSLAALFAILTSLHATPATLMRPKAPKIGKRVLLEKIPFIWHHMGFVQKVTARNLLRYKKRFFMTVFGIAGCTALILTGFGLRNSVDGLVDKQFGEVMLYDLQIVFEKEISDIKTDETYSWLTESSEMKSLTPLSAQKADVVSSKAPEVFEATLMVPVVPADFASYISLHTRVGKTEVLLTDEGVIITEKLARLKNVKVGDSITIQDINDRIVTVEVSGICENYTGHYIYMTPALFEKLYEKEAPVNAVLSFLTDRSESAIEDFKEILMNQTNIAGTIFVPLMKSELSDTFASLDYVTLVLILSAFALDMVVLYNLTNININERIREIATIKVLGFYDPEVSSYVFRENAVITILGSGIGLVLGAVLHGFVTETAETDMIMFGRTIEIKSYVISFALTVIFSLFVNLVMHFYLKRISMVESLKSIE